MWKFTIKFSKPISYLNSSYLPGEISLFKLASFQTSHVKSSARGRGNINFFNSSSAMNSMQSNAVSREQARQRKLMAVWWSWPSRAMWWTETTTATVFRHDLHQTSDLICIALFHIFIKWFILSSVRHNSSTVAQQRISSPECRERLSRPLAQLAATLLSRIRFFRIKYPQLISLLDLEIVSLAYYFFVKHAEALWRPEFRWSASEFQAIAKSEAFQQQQFQPVAELPAEAIVAWRKHPFLAPKPDYI